MGLGKFSSPITTLLNHTDGRLGPDLVSGRGKLFGGHLNVDDEVSEKNFKPLQSLHHCSVGYQSV
jgi:hypothetical protein